MHATRPDRSAGPRAAGDVNFLTEGEINARGADRIPPDTREVMLTIEAGVLGAMAEQANRARETGDFSGMPVEMNAEIHRRLADEGREYYAALLREITDANNRPLVFHCSHGVHRTGTAAAILLWSLGVPWETVREDYLLSNVYRRETIEKRVEQLRRVAAEHQGVSPEQVDVTNISAFYNLDGSYIDATRDWILDEYGSIDGYLRQGLGLTESEIEQLRAELLQ